MFLLTFLLLFIKKIILVFLCEAVNSFEKGLQKKLVMN